MTTADGGRRMANIINAKCSLFSILYFLLSTESWPNQPSLVTPDSSFGYLTDCILHFAFCILHFAATRSDIGALGRQDD